MIFLFFKVKFEFYKKFLVEVDKKSFSINRYIKKFDNIYFV